MLGGLVLWPSQAILWVSCIRPYVAWHCPLALSWLSGGMAAATDAVAAFAFGLQQLATMRLDEAVLQVTAPAGDRDGTPLLNRVPTNNLLASLLSSSASPGHGKEAVGHHSSCRDIVRQVTISAARAACGSGLYPSRWQKHCHEILSEAGNVAVDAGRCG